MSAQTPIYRQWVAGELVAGDRTASIIDPATEQEVGRYYVAGVSTIDAAVTAGLAAFQEWRLTSRESRRSLLMRLAALVEHHIEHLACLLTLEQGKPLAEATEEVQFTVSVFRHYAAAALPDTEEVRDATKQLHLRRYSALGVVAGIIPWNFPLLIAAMKIAPAVLAGNTIILKPAPTTPLTTFEFARLCAAIVPAGLIQVIGDDGSVGPRLTAHPDIRKISFTGSTATGRSVMSAAAATLKRIDLELGGNDPAILLPDVDIKVAAAGIFRAAFANCGQICGAVKRVYIHEAIYEEFCQRLSELVTSAVVGNGFTAGVTMGPLQNNLQYEKALDLLNAASRDGKVIAQAVIPSGPGYFVAPTLVTGLPESHPLVQSEQFAPLLPLQQVSSVEEAIRHANATPYGLTASVWSSDPSQAEAIAMQLDASLICINRHNEQPLELGVSMCKASGHGWMFGPESLAEYLQPHLILR